MPSNVTSEQDQLQVFVYGTLRRGYVNYERVLAGLTTAEESAQIAGATLYDAGGFPFVVLDPSKPGSVVVGDLMTIDPARYDDVLHELDVLEGYYPLDEGNLYERLAAKVRIGTRFVTAWIYAAGPGVGHKDFSPEDIIPGGDWAQVGQQGNTAERTLTADSGHPHRTAVEG